ncbi:MAG: hypothetical protein ACKO4W_00155, partial [Bacteroidota bacterium]
MLPSVSSLYCAAIVPFFQANVHQIGATPAKNHGLKNLFVAGTNIKENNPCVAIISLNYLSWDILVKENDYEFQRNSILALIL